MKAIERLFIYFENKSLRHTRVEKELNLTNGYFGKMRDRKGSIGSDILETIFCEFPDLNPSWLLTGEGLMLKSESPNNLITHSGEFTNSTINSTIGNGNINIKEAKTTKKRHGISSNNKISNVSGTGNTVGNNVVNGNVMGDRNHVGILPSNYEMEIAKNKTEIEILKKQLKDKDSHYKKLIEEMERRHKEDKAILNKLLEHAMADKNKAIEDKDKAMNMLDKALSK